MASTELQHVVLLSIDDLRFDCVGWQLEKRYLRRGGKTPPRTPNLDALASQGACFLQAISPGTYTTSTHASLLTGRYPPRHGIRPFFLTGLSPEVQTLTEVFAEAGYATALASDAPEILLPCGLGRAFQNVFTRDDNGLIRFLREHRKGKTFTLIHFFDVHDPYLFCDCESPVADNEDYYEAMEDLYNRLFPKVDCPVRENPHGAYRQLVRESAGRGRSLLFDLYLSGVEKFDRVRLPRLINELEDGGFLDNGLLVVFSDHGEGGRGFREGHAANLWDEVIRVVLLMVGLPVEPRLIEHQVSLVDVPLTILELAGLSLSNDYDGRSLVPALMGQSLPERPVYAEVCLDFRMTPGGRNRSSSEPGPDPQFFIRQRAVRFRNRKHVIAGELESPRLHVDGVCSDEVFVQTAYQNLLGRFPQPGEVQYWVQALDSGSTRRGVLVSFLKSKEYRRRVGARRVLATFDLTTDFFEARPIDPFSDPCLTIDFLHAFSFIRSFEDWPVQPSAVDHSLGLEDRLWREGKREKSTTQDRSESRGQDEERVLNRLRDLGYVED